MGSIPSLTPDAIEGDTYPIRVRLTDRLSGEAIIPDALAWTLTDTAGTVINNREGEVLTPAATMYVVLSGDDLTASAGAPAERVVTLEGTFTDSDYGATLPIRREIRVTVVPRVLGSA